MASSGVRIVMTNNISVEYRDISRLIPYARNARTHSDEQVAKIAASIREFGWTSPILVDGDNGIIAGHGRLAAARKLGLDQVPVIELAHLTPAQKRAYVIADNKLALDAGWDTELLALELGELKLDRFDIELTGFDAGELDELMSPEQAEEAHEEEEDEYYSRKIESPIYEITGAKPEVFKLFDAAKTERLIANIESSQVGEDFKAFLKLAAYRHVVFSYQAIAERYAHGTPEEQRLMEDSALVIIDFDRAIEEGYVRLTKEMAEQYKVNKVFRGI